MRKNKSFQKEIQNTYRGYNWGWDKKDGRRPLMGVSFEDTPKKISMKWQYRRGKYSFWRPGSLSKILSAGKDRAYNDVYSDIVRQITSPKVRHFIDKALSLWIIDGKVQKYPYFRRFRIDDYGILRENQYFRSRSKTKKSENVYQKDGLVYIIYKKKVKEYSIIKTKTLIGSPTYLILIPARNPVTNKQIIEEARKFYRKLEESLPMPCVRHKGLTAEQADRTLKAHNRGFKIMPWGEMQYRE